MEAIADIDEHPGREMNNMEVAEVLYEIADLLELQGVSFKPQAYRRAARSIEQLDEPLASVAASGKLEELPGVGAAIAKKLEELLETGQLEYLDKLRSEVPEGLTELLRVPDIGPRTAVQLHRELGISGLDELKRAAIEHRIRSLKGMGEKTEERILQGISMLEQEKGRTLLGEALPVAEAYLAYLRSAVEIEMADVAGSLRRGRDTIGDIDILVSHGDPGPVMNAFVGYPPVEDVLMRGPTKSSVVLDTGMQVDLRVVRAESYGAALQYFTGSKEHNVSMRRAALELGYKLNEYGLFERDTDKMVAGKSEAELYETLGFQYIPPELRENAGELAAAREQELPDLVTQDQIRGDFHVHSDWSDGLSTVKRIAGECKGRGYEYVAITDHSQSLKIANGLSPERLSEQIDSIRQLQESLGSRFRVFSGCEVDIKADGSLDMPAHVLKELDIVIASVHSRFKMDIKEMTRRVCSAIESGRIDVLGHPTGRLIEQRGSYALDLGKVLDSAAEHRVCMEVNAFFNRLDLRDVDCRAAKERGVAVAIGTDSHRLEHLEFIRLGVITARRGWLEPKDVLNAMSANEVERWIGGRKP